jgi:hypothetical protein
VVRHRSGLNTTNKQGEVSALLLLWRRRYLAAVFAYLFPATLTLAEPDANGMMQGFATARDVYPQGEASVNGGPIPGDLVFRYVCAP